MILLALIIFAVIMAYILMECRLAINAWKEAYLECFRIYGAEDSVYGSLFKNMGRVERVLNAALASLVLFVVFCMGVIPSICGIT